MKKILTVLFVSAIAFSGCDLDTYLDPKYPPEVPWKSVDELEMAAVLPYALMIEGWTSPGAVYNVYDYLISDIAAYIPGTSTNSPYEVFCNRKHREVTMEANSAGWVLQLFKQSYVMIAAANDPLGFLEGYDRGENLFPKEHKSYQDANIPRVQAELHFWRAMGYYYLGMMFAPPYDQNGENIDSILPLKKSVLDNPSHTRLLTTQQLWDFVISDLRKAKSKMPKSYNVNGRINYYTIAGALARTQFYLGNYEAADSACTEIIDEGGYWLQDSVVKAWDAGMHDPAAPEVIFDLIPNELTYGSYMNVTIINKAFYDTFNGGRDSVNWSKSPYLNGMFSMAKLADLGWMVDPLNGDYTETDLAKNDQRYNEMYYRLEGFSKYSQLQPPYDTLTYNEYKLMFETHNQRLTFPAVYLDKYYRGETAKLTKIPFMRLPEFHLMRAVIRLDNGNPDGAADDVNVVRTRAGLPDLGNDLSIQDIDREFVIEYTGEGLYIPYMMGQQRPIPPGDREDVAPVEAPYSSWYWFLPEAEMKFNSAYDGYNPNNLE